MHTCAYWGGLLRAQFWRIEGNKIQQFKKKLKPYDITNVFIFIDREASQIETGEGGGGGVILLSNTGKGKVTTLEHCGLKMLEVEAFRTRATQRQCHRR